MSFAERAKAPANKILILDVETSPTLTYTFGMRPKWISPEKIVEPSRVLCYGAKWYGQTKLHFKSEYHHDRQAMVEGIWNLLDAAEIVVSFNGIRFDNKHLRREFFDAGMPPPSPWKDVDLYVASKQFSYESHSLNHLAQRLGLGQKVAHSGFDLWKQCLAGNKAAWAQMKSYQLGDIELTESVYERMGGWLPNHPHHLMGTSDDRVTCNQCWGSNLERNSVKLAQQITYTLWRCLDCGANVQGTRHSRAAITRGAR